MTACNAWVEKYVGKGLERVKHSGQCPLDLGHDGDHVPPGMLNTGFTQVPTDQLDEAKALAQGLDGWDGISTEVERLQELLRSWG